MMKKSKKHPPRASQRVQKDMESLAKSFRFALQGFRYAVNNERNMRIHLSVALLVTQFALLYGLDRHEYAVLFIMFGVVLTAEMLNTAIEAMVNLETQNFTPLARVAKDVAAGAVFVLSIAAVLVGLMLFSTWENWVQIKQVLWDFPWLIAVCLIESLLAYLFVFRWDMRHLLRKK